MPPYLDRDKTYSKVFLVDYAIQHRTEFPRLATNTNTGIRKMLKDQLVAILVQPSTMIVDVQPDTVPIDSRIASGTSGTIPRMIARVTASRTSSPEASQTPPYLALGPSYNRIYLNNYAIKHKEKFAELKNLTNTDIRKMARESLWNILKARTSQRQPSPQPTVQPRSPPRPELFSRSLTRIVARPIVRPTSSPIPYLDRTKKYSKAFMIEHALKYKSKFPQLASLSSSKIRSFRKEDLFAIISSRLDDIVFVEDTPEPLAIPPPPPPPETTVPRLVFEESTIPPPPPPLPEPLPERLPEPVVERLPEPVVEPIAEPVVEPLPEPVVEPIAEPAGEPATILIATPYIPPSFEPEEEEKKSFEPEEEKKSFDPEEEEKKSFEPEEEEKKSFEPEEEEKKSFEPEEEKKIEEESNPWLRKTRAAYPHAKGELVVGTTTVLGQKLYIDKKRKINWIKDWFYLDPSHEHTEKELNAAFTIYFNSNVFSKVDKKSYLGLLNSDGFHANYTLYYKEHIGNGLEDYLYTSLPDYYFDIYAKKNILTNKYFCPKGGAIKLYYNQAIPWINFDENSNTLQKSNDPEWVKAFINTCDEYKYYFKLPYEIKLTNKNFEVYRHLFCVNGAMFNILNKGYSTDPQIYKWDYTTKSVIVIALPLISDVNPVTYKPFYKISEANFNNQALHENLFIFIMSKQSLVDWPRLIEEAYTDGLGLFLRRHLTIITSSGPLTRDVRGLERGSPFPFTQKVYKPIKQPYLVVEQFSKKELLELSFADLVKLCKSNYISTNILTSDIGEDLSQSEIEKRAKPILIDRFLRIRDLRNNKRSYPKGFGVHPKLGTLFEVKDIEQSFNGNYEGYTLEEHVLGEYDLDLTWKEHDYKWSDFPVKFECKVPNDVSVKPEKVKLKVKDFDPNYVEDPVVGDTIYEYLAQAKAFELIAKAYGNVPEYIIKCVAEKIDLPDLTIEKAIKLQEEISNTTLEFKSQDGEVVTAACSDEYIVTSGSHPGYHVKYGAMDMPVLLPSNIVYLEGKSGQTKVIFLESVLTRWEQGLSYFDYTSYRVIPQYPKMFVTESNASPEELCLILEYAKKRDMLKNFPVLNRSIYPNLETMAYLYWWINEYNASDSYYQKLKTDDKAIWNKRDIMAIYFLEKIANRLGFKNEGFRKFNFMESAQQNMAIFAGCLIKEIILENFTLQMTLPERTVQWVKGVRNNRKANRDSCEREKESMHNPCNPCFNTKVAISAGTHDWTKF